MVNRTLHLGTSWGGAVDAAETTAFLNRTSGLDATHVDAYKALINGLVTDGILAKHDTIYIHATSTTTNALLSLVSATFDATVVNSPTFTADAGYTGNGSNMSISSNFNPSTASSPKYVQDSATVWAWSNTAASDGASMIGYASPGDNLYLYNLDGTDIEANINNAVGFQGVANPGDGKGLYAVSRTGFSNYEMYKNGSSVVATTVRNSGAVGNLNIVALTGDGGFFSGQIMAWGIGSQLSGAEHANLYARVHTYLQTIAGIA